MKSVGKMTQGELGAFIQSQLRDRSDQQSLVQAILVAKRNKINLDEIRSWSLAEGKRDEFERIKGKLIK